MRLVVVGGGIIGLAAAATAARAHPDVDVIVLEKESRVASHQTGHNSGVVHAGIYYAPGSLKARLCGRGAQLLREYCGQHAISYDVCGKVVVATTAEELPALAQLHQRAQ